MAIHSSHLNMHIPLYCDYDILRNKTKPKKTKQNEKSGGDGNLQFTASGSEKQSGLATDLCGGGSLMELTLNPWDLRLIPGRQCQN